MNETPENDEDYGERAWRTHAGREWVRASRENVGWYEDTRKDMVSVGVLEVADRNIWHDTDLRPEDAKEFGEQIVELAEEAMENNE